MPSTVLIDAASRAVAATVAIALIAPTPALAQQTISRLPRTGPLLLVDTEGKTVGRFADWQNVILTVNGVAVAVPIESAAQPPHNDPSKLVFFGDGRLYFDNSACTGQPYTRVGLPGVTPSVLVSSMGDGKTWLFVASGTPALLSLPYVLYQGSCDGSGGYFYMSSPLGTPIDLTSRYSPPFVIR